MKNVLCIFFILVAFSTTIFARPVIRIKFPKGATEVTVTGKLNSFKDSQTFLVNLRGGQTFEIEDIDEMHPVTVSVYDSTGKNVDDLDLSCHGNFSLSKTKAGDYKVVVTQCMKADPWKGSFKLKVTATNN